MNAFAAVMTGKGVGAISTIGVFGDLAASVLKKIFTPAGGHASFETGKILLGTINDNGKTIDQIMIGCEGENNFAIHCHGNPLIVKLIMGLLGRNGVELLTAEQSLARILAEENDIDTIGIEAKLAICKAKTIEGSRIITNQIQGGLRKKASRWLDEISQISLKEINADAEGILADSRIAKVIINGCKAVIAGPPNSGKSTLLNCLCGKEKAIVTDIKGTTRDWVSAVCQIESLCLELIDTAGLDGQLAGIVEKKSQQKTEQLLQQADLVLLVLDGSCGLAGLEENLLEKLVGKKVLTVLNKSDLPIRFKADTLPVQLSSSVQISAKLGEGVQELIESIRRVCGVAGFDLQSAVCFTERQENLLGELAETKSQKQAFSLITELLKGQLDV